MAFLQFRLNINILPVSFGLGASIILFILVFLMALVHNPGGISSADKPAVGSAGILQLIWLSSRHSQVRERIAEVENPSDDNLRRAGLFKASLGVEPPGKEATDTVFR
ncbi:hypothetical protein BV22DRAFT_410219 [Leucogyrophana mollusca]|uniref:Uncharacterized protein n=1 Tax=Leucogyrophana mollusca TaxID=85980 RepID=A0ACB8BJ07_9AGAM|nr:hypothetical protein BV22DRAFT_410219 [Leucogyrophana mollusca]